MQYADDVLHEVRIPSGRVYLDGLLLVPKNAKALVLFVHGSGSSRFSVRNQHVAQVLNEAGLATLLFDLLTSEEEIIDSRTRELRFDIPFLASRLIDVTQWCVSQVTVNPFKFGYFGASTGAGAALVASARLPHLIRAVVSRGGRPDLAGDSLPLVAAPTLLIVGGDDEPVIKMNQDARLHMVCHTQLEIIPGATHLFEEPGTLDLAAQSAKKWFLTYLV